MREMSNGEFWRSVYVSFLWGGTATQASHTSDSPVPFSHTPALQAAARTRLYRRHFLVNVRRQPVGWNRQSTGVFRQCGQVTCRNRGSVASRAARLRILEPFEILICCRITGTPAAIPLHPLYDMASSPL